MSANEAIFYTVSEIFKTIFVLSFIKQHVLQKIHLKEGFKQHVSREKEGLPSQLQTLETLQAKLQSGAGIQHQEYRSEFAV